MRPICAPDTDRSGRDMYVVNDLDRFDELGDLMNRLPRLGARAAYFKQAIGHNLIEHK